MRAKKSVSMKVVVLLLAVVLLIGFTVGGTLAWLVTKTEPVTNTFVAGNIGTLNLEETTGTSYTVTPGVDIKKDPKVTFTGNNVAAYVFLKVDADKWDVSNSGTTYTYLMGDGKMCWTLDGWTELESGVYYKEVEANSENQSWSIISNDKITVSSEITQDNIDVFNSNLSFTAYAIQKEGFTTAKRAWEEAQKLN